MWQYLIIFAIPLFAHIVGKGKYCHSSGFLKFFMFGLALFVGLGDMLGGYDRYIYGEIFDNLADDLYAGVSMSESFAFAYFEPGYMIFNWLIAHITGNRYVFILLITLIMYTNFYIAFKRHVTNYPLAFMVFLGLLFFFSFTYLRQILGCSFAMLSIKYLLERKRWQFFTIILLVFLMHKSGLVFAIMYFLPLRKFNRTSVLTVFAACLIIGVSGIGGTLYDAYIETANVDDRFEYARQDDARIAYLLEVAVFSFVILSNYKYIGNKKEEIMFLNMALVFCCILLMFIRSENGGRMTWYFIVGLIVTMANMINNVPTQKAKLLQTIVIVLFFGLFFRISNEWGILLSPYKTFLTSGYRSGDYIREHYEYDTRYDDDKFYRLRPFQKYK